MNFEKEGTDPLLYLFFFGLLLLPILFTISVLIDKNSPLATKMRICFSGSSHPVNVGYGEFPTDSEDENENGNGNENEYEEKNEKINTKILFLKMNKIGNIDDIEITENTKNIIHEP